MNPEKQIQLKNNKGECLILRLREYRQGDEGGMIACIRDEYGETYFKRGFYRSEYIKKQAEEGNITFLVAQTMSGEIAGMLILKQFYPEEAMCEIASQIFRKKYRGWGLAMPFFEYGMEILLSRSYSAAYCLPVTFHPITQVLLYRLGLRAAGFVLNVFDMEKIIHSYQNGRNTKHSQAVQIMPLGKKDAGMLYIPRKHQAFCRAVYESAKAAYQFAPEKETCCVQEKIPEKSNISYINDEVQSSLEIRIYRAGRDLKQRIEAIHARFPLQGKQTANIFLNCSDPCAVWAYECLENMGYFFTGLKPLCSEKEYIILHNPGETVIYFEDYAVSDEFASLLYYVCVCYEEQYKIKDNYKDSQVP